MNQPPQPPSTTPPSSTIHLPRVLCLHGGGVNAPIFHSQLRTFLADPILSTLFRFVFINAPFPCEEGIGVSKVYDSQKWGSYRRWFRWLDSHEVIDDQECREEVWRVVREGMDGDEGTGEWVGVLGFSQGAKLAGSLLYESQVNGGHQWKFGVIFAGRAPLVALSDVTDGWEWLQRAGGLPDTADMDSILERPEMRLTVPTVHVHGLKDEGLELHRRCVQDYCAPGTVWLVEWDGPHRLPIKKSDVKMVVDAILEVVHEYGIVTARTPMSSV